MTKQSPKKHFFNERRKKERLFGATFEVGTEKSFPRNRRPCAGAPPPCRGMEASSESDASSPPASPWEDDPACLSRSLYDTPSDTDTSRDDEDEEPVCYFYLAPRGALTRGVGAAREPPGRRERPPHLAVRVNPETGRPFAPAGEDDSSTLERCATNHASRCRWNGGAEPIVVCVERHHHHRPERPEDTRGDDENVVYGIAGSRADAPRVAYAPPRGSAKPAPLSLKTLAARTLGASLRSRHVPRLPPLGSLNGELVDEMMDFAAPDARILAMAFAAGVTRLHLKDFESILDDAHLNVAAWRCWHSKAWRTEAPPDARDENKKPGPADPPEPARATPVPPFFVALDREGVPRRVRDPKTWLRVFQHALDLRTFAVESGVSGEGPSTEACLRVVVDGLVAAGNVEDLTLAYFDCVTDETLAGAWPPGGVLNAESGGVPKSARGIVRARRFESSRVVEPPPLRVIGSSPGLRRLTSLRLSHLPGVTDATVLAALDRCVTLRTLRLEFLGVTDACLGAARPGGWRDALRRLERLEVKACPYVRFAHPGVDFKRPPRRLATLRIQPGGAPRRGADAEFRVFGDENVRRGGPDAKPEKSHSVWSKPKGGRADMCLSSRHVTQLARSRDSNITHLCLGAEFKGVERDARKLGLRGDTGGYRADDLLDLRATHFPSVRVLEIFRNETQVIWPRRFGGVGNPWAKTLVDLTVETPSDALGERLAGCVALKRLRVCDFSGATVHEFSAFAKMGVVGEKSARVRLERFIGGGVREDLEPHVPAILAAFAPELQDAHFHREPEYPD